jgi:ferric-dicitrate binding protein FerR (iron transport regulator)
MFVRLRQKLIERRIAKHIKKKAAEWLVELDTTEEIEKVWPAFEDWLDETPEHRTAFQRMEQAWTSVGELAFLFLDWNQSIEGNGSLFSLAAYEKNAAAIWKRPHDMWSRARRRLRVLIGIADRDTRQ